MQHKAPTYIRKGQTISPADPTDSKLQPKRTFDSISQAKHHSLLLQRANGGRGMGYVRVAKTN